MLFETLENRSMMSATIATPAVTVTTPQPAVVTSLPAVQRPLPAVQLPIGTLLPAVQITLRP